VTLRQSLLTLIIVIIIIIIIIITVSVFDEMIDKPQSVDVKL